jgi:hypothetical protein
MQTTQQQNNAITSDQNLLVHQGRISRPAAELDSRCIFLFLFQSHYFLATLCYSVGSSIPLVHLQLLEVTFPNMTSLFLDCMNDAV